jgi:heme exporter protein B
MRALFLAVLLRDLRLAARRRIDALLPLVFFIVALSLFPLGVGPEPQTLRHIAPGVVWVCALLATMLSVQQLYAGDQADGSLEQMLLAPAAGHRAGAGQVHGALAAQRRAAGGGVAAGGHAVRHVAAGHGLLVLGLLLGTPVLSLLGGLGAALTLGLRSGGMLLILIVLPLAMPVLIFGTGAVGSHRGRAVGFGALFAAGRACWSARCWAHRWPLPQRCAFPANERCGNDPGPTEYCTGTLEPFLPTDHPHDPRPAPVHLCRAAQFYGWPGAAALVWALPRC